MDDGHSEHQYAYFVLSPDSDIKADLEGHAAQVEALVARIRTERGRLDILVNDIWGGEHLFEWNKTVWEHNLENGLRLLKLAVDTHLITAHHALPLMIARPGGGRHTHGVGARQGSCGLWSLGGLHNAGVDAL